MSVTRQKVIFSWITDSSNKHLGKDMPNIEWEEQ